MGSRHLANFLHTPGWSNPSQMKATTDKKGAQVQKLHQHRKPTGCLSARRERGHDAAAIPCLLTSLSCCAKQGAWEDWSSHCNQGRSSPADSQGTTEDSRQRIPGHRPCCSPRHNMQFPTVFSNNRPKRIYCATYMYARCYTTHFRAHSWPVAPWLLGSRHNIQSLSSVCPAPICLLLTPQLPVLCDIRSNIEYKTLPKLQLC